MTDNEHIDKMMYDAEMEQRMEELEMTAFAMDNMINEMIYEAEINVRKYARIVLNLSRIGNTKGANHYREKLSEERRALRLLRAAY